MSSHHLAFHILQSTLPTSCRRMSLATAWSVMTCHESSWNILESYNHLSDPVQFLHGSFMKDSYICYIFSHLSVHLQRCQKPLSKRTVAMPKHGKATAKFLLLLQVKKCAHSNSFSWWDTIDCHWIQHGREIAETNIGASWNRWFVSLLSWLVLSWLKSKANSWSLQKQLRGLECTECTLTIIVNIRWSIRSTVSTFNSCLSAGEVCITMPRINRRIEKVWTISNLQHLTSLELVRAASRKLSCGKSRLSLSDCAPLFI